MSENGGLFRTALSKFIGAIAAASGALLFAWSLGWWPAAWRAIASTAVAVWNALVYMVPVLVVVVIVVLLRMLRGMWRSIAAQAASLPTISAESLRLDPVEESLLRALARLDGRRVGLEHMAINLGVPKLIL